MEVDGKEFLRNVSLEQDKERLIQEQRKLEALKRDSVMKNRSYSAPREESAYVDLSSQDKTPYKEEENIIDDIMLEPEDPEKNKKRYILLGIGLILIFIITILVIRLVSNNDTKEKMENLNPETKELATDKILDKIDTNEEYQKVIDKNSALEEIQKQEKTKQNNLNEIVIPNETAQDTSLMIDKPKSIEEPQRDLFGLTKEEVAQKQEVVEVDKPQPKPVVEKKVVNKLVEQVKKEVVVKTPVVTAPLTTKSTNVSGYYIQIGAFTKEPDKNLLSSISSKGYDYNVHQMTIKGTVYNKVLIGAYPTKEIALKDLDKVKKDFNNKNAYILKF
jgi:DedD protein